MKTLNNQELSVIKGSGCSSLEIAAIIAYYGFNPTALAIALAGCIY